MSDPLADRAGEELEAAQGAEPPLMQIRLGRGDPWRVVAVSRLLQRTRPVVSEPVAERLFKRWPTARSLARADRAKVLATVRQLGFQNRRTDQLIAVAKAFDAGDPSVVGPGLPSREWVRGLPGVGEYVEQAYRLVVLGDTTFEPEDWALKRWWEWRVGVRR